MKYMNDIRRASYHKTRNQSTSLNERHSLSEMIVICWMAVWWFNNFEKLCVLCASFS